MKVIFDQSFIKSLDKIGEKDIRKRVEKIIIQIESVPSPDQIYNIKKLQGVSKLLSDQNRRLPVRH
jgi:mRNA-degrading endonuclease RelE of RelBE toxin-antitoxin system